LIIDYLQGESRAMKAIASKIELPIIKPSFTI
jgi:hypothetical protein